MSYNGSGTFNINTTGQPVVAGTVISSSAFNALTTDLATGLTTAITKDGQTTTTARITFAQGITSSLVTDSSSVSTGSIITGGGVGIAKNLYVGVNANVAGTLGVTGVATFSAAPIYSSLTASSAVATDASKGLVSVTNTGTGNNVLATSPTITTPTISGDATISGLTVGKGGGAVSTNTAVGASALTTNSTGAYNTAVGYQAGYTNSTGVNNVAVGGEALKLNTTDYCTAVGYRALLNNSTGARNSAFGHYAGNGNTTGGYNTFIGSYAGESNTTGANNTVLGYQALDSNTTASDNTAVGYQALYTNSTGQLNVAVGALSLYNNTANSNNAFGYNSLNKTTSGGSNSAFGHASAYNNTTGSSNVAVGHTALFSNTTASNNTAVGYQALYSKTGGSTDGNVSVGYQAGYSSTTSTTNTFLGVQAGYYNTTGNSNVMIGSNAGALSVNATTGDGNIYIGGGVRGSAAGNATEIVIGYVTTGKGSNTGFINPNGGGVYQGNNGATWSVTSDRRLKKNIVDNNNGLDIINQIQVRNFEYRVEEEVTELPQDQAIKKQGIQLGVIAQELKEILPECVKTESTGVMTVDADNLTWYLINAVKELTARIKQLEGN